MDGRRADALGGDGLGDDSVKIYVTKYALSKGIEEVEPNIEICEDGKQYVSHGWAQRRLGQDCFTDRADAVADAEKRRIERIASLKKQLAKLEALEFKL